MHGRILRVDFAPDEMVAFNNPPHYKLYIREFDGDERTLREVFQDFEKQIVRVNISPSSFFFLLFSVRGN
jgi:hypothetical protein